MSASSANITPTYMDCPWFVNAQWQIAYKTKVQGKSKRHVWAKDLGQVTDMSFSLAWKKHRRSAKEAIVKVFTNTMERRDPPLAFRVATLDTKQCPASLRTSLGGKTAAQVASTFLTFLEL